MKNNIDQLGQKLTQKDFEAMLTAVNQTSLVSVTDKEGDIIYANETFVKVAKYSLDELLGQNHRILKSGHQPDSLFVDLWDTISNGKVWRGEIKNKAKDGTYYWVDTSIAPILDDNGEPERYIAVRFLINDKKELEADLHKQITELEKLNSIMVGREARMAEIKKEIKKCEAKLKRLRAHSE